MISENKMIMAAKNETLYAAAAHGTATVPWAGFAPPSTAGLHIGPSRCRP
jgi:hypothetical protein